MPSYNLPHQSCAFKKRIQGASSSLAGQLQRAAASSTIIDSSQLLHRSRVGGSAKDHVVVDTAEVLCTLITLDVLSRLWHRLGRPPMRLEEDARTRIGLPLTFLSSSQGAYDSFRKAVHEAPRLSESPLGHLIAMHNNSW